MSIDRWNNNSRTYNVADQVRLSSQLKCNWLVQFNLLVFFQFVKVSLIFVFLLAHRPIKAADPTEATRGFDWAARNTACARCIANLSCFRGIELPARCWLSSRPDASFLGFPPVSQSRGQSSLRLLDSPRRRRKNGRFHLGAERTSRVLLAEQVVGSLILHASLQVFLSPKLIEFEKTFETLPGAAVNWRISFGLARLVRLKTGAQAR